jgi:hypothetical protein
MGLDLRWPIGLMFTIIGALLTVAGLFAGSDAEKLKPSLGININLWWGLVLLAFGVFMLLMARKGSKPAAGQTPAESAASKLVNPPKN